MADDDDRLIQEVLAELGRDADPIQIAQQVRRLDRGLPAEDEFIAVCSWLGKTRLIHKLDQHQAPSQSHASYQVPDLLAIYEESGPVLIEVKSKKASTLSFRPDYLARLQTYADVLQMPLLIAWKYHGMMFGHMALVHLLNWPLQDGEQINWRHAIRRESVVSNMTNFTQALQRALEQKVVRIIINQQPLSWPEFVTR